MNKLTARLVSLVVIFALALPAVGASAQPLVQRPQGIGLGLRHLGQSALGLRPATQIAYFMEPNQGAVALNASSMVVDPSGGIHAVMEFSQVIGDDTFFPVDYAYCPSVCGSPDRWSWVQLGDYAGGAAGSAEIGLNPLGRPRVMWYNDGEELGEPPYTYAECNSNCTNHDSWYLSGGLPGGQTHPNGVTYFALDPQGRPRYVYPGEFGPVYVACDADCNDPAHWSQFLTNASNHLSSYESLNLVVNASGLPRLLGDMATSNNDLVYRACTINPCDLTVDWSDVHLLSLGSNVADDDWDLALDSQGRPRVALYQDGQLSYWWSDGNPLDFSTWKHYPISLPSGYFGMDVDLAIDRGDFPHLAFNFQDATQANGLIHMVCSANCQPQSGSAIWGAPLQVETTDVLDTIDPVPFLPDCVFSAWMTVGTEPSLALDGGGNPVILYLTRHLQNGPNPSSGCWMIADQISLRMALIYNDFPPPWETKKFYLPLLKK